MSQSQSFVIFNGVSFVIILIKSNFGYRFRRDLMFARPKRVEGNGFWFACKKTGFVIFNGQTLFDDCFFHTFTLFRLGRSPQNSSRISPPFSSLKNPITFLFFPVGMPLGCSFGKLLVSNMDSTSGEMSW